MGDSYDPKIFQELLADISLFFFLGFLGFLYRKWTRNVGDSYEQQIFQELFADISLFFFLSDEFCQNVRQDFDMYRNIDHQKAKKLKKKQREKE